MKKLTLSTSEGRWRLLALFAALIILFSACGNAVITGGYKFNCKTVTLDVQGASLSIEQYEPRNISSDSSIPCVILFHGGSESLSATGMGICAQRFCCAECQHVQLRPFRTACRDR